MVCCRRRTMRYSPLITPALRVYKGSAQVPYEVVSVDDVEDRHRWLEVLLDDPPETDQGPQLPGVCLFCHVLPSRCVQVGHIFCHLQLVRKAAAR